MKMLGVGGAKGRVAQGCGSPWHSALCQALGTGTGVTDLIAVIFWGAVRAALSSERYDAGGLTGSFYWRVRWKPIKCHAQLNALLFFPESGCKRFSRFASGLCL